MIIKHALDLNLIAYFRKEVNNDLKNEKLFEIVALWNKTSKQQYNTLNTLGKSRKTY